MKILKKITIFVVACAAIFTCYLSFAKKDVNASEIVTIDYEFPCTATVALGDDFEITYAITPTLPSVSTVSRKNAAQTISKVLVTVTYPVYEGSGNSTVGKIETYELTVGKVNYITINISAPLMAETISIQRGTLSTTITPIYSGSLLELIGEIRPSNPTTDTDINKKDLCNKTILYGYYTATYFGKDTTDYANYLTTEEMKPYITEIANVSLENLSSYKLSFGSSNSCFKMVGFNFNCSSKCYVRIYFEKTSSIDIANFTFTVNSNTYTPVLENSRYYIDVPVKISELTTTINKLVITQYNTSSSVYECSFYGTSYSYLLLNKYNESSTDKDTLITISKLIYVLGVAAKNYVG